MEFKNKIFGEFFLRNAGTEEKIEVYGKRLRSVQIMTVVMGILSLIYVVAAICAVGAKHIFASLWLPASLTGYTVWNTDFAMIMAHVADICRIGLYAGFCWGFRSLVMRVSELFFPLVYIQMKIAKFMFKLLYFVPFFGFMIVAMMDIVCEVMICAGPFTYGGLAVFALMPFWPLVALAQYYLYSRKLKKLEEEPVTVIPESVIEQAS